MGVQRRLQQWKRRWDQCINAKEDYYKVDNAGL
jgi:hypothetical protein